MRELDFERDIEINPDALDVELLDHANLFGRYSDKATQAETKAKRAAEKKKSTFANLTMHAQRNSDVLGGAKPTQANVEAWVRDHKEYQQVVNELIDAEHDAAVLKNAVFAFNHRKSMLENLVRLCLGEYFAGPNIPRDLRKEWDASGRGRDANVVERQKERKRGRAK